MQLLILDKNWWLKVQESTWLRDTLFLKVQECLKPIKNSNPRQLRLFLTNLQVQMSTKKNSNSSTTNSRKNMKTLLRRRWSHNMILNNDACQSITNLSFQTLRAHSQTNNAYNGDPSNYLMLLHLWQTYLLCGLWWIVNISKSREILMPKIAIWRATFYSRMQLKLFQYWEFLVSVMTKSNYSQLIAQNLGS